MRCRWRAGCCSRRRSSTPIGVSPRPGRPCTRPVWRAGASRGPTFNKESTWRLLTRDLGDVCWETYDYRSYDRVLSAAFARGERLYSAACIVPPPQLGEDRKHRNHLRLLEMMMTSGAAERVAEAATMRQAYEVLLSYPAIGPFLAYQFTIDLNYAPQLAFSEMDFVVPGAGARDGIRKCFGPAADGIEADLIRYMADSQRDHFDRL